MLFRSIRLAVTTTCAPSAPNRSAIALPMPLLLPVTIATLSLRRYMDSFSLYLSSREWPRLPFPARIERAHSYRARSASKKDTWPLPPILLEVIFCHAIPERIAGDLEEPAGFGNVPACAVQRFLQHLFFHLVNREAEGQEGGLLGASIRFC